MGTLEWNQKYRPEDVKLAPSILSADFSRLGEEVRTAEQAGADWIHVDVMDGHFVPNITIGPVVVKNIRRSCGLPFDVHLMIESPDKFVQDFIDAGADLVTVHAEALEQPRKCLAMIKDGGAKAGLSLNPATPLEPYLGLLAELDLLLLMTVNPGLGGQGFIDSVVPKIEEARAYADENGLGLDIEVDGGIKPSNARMVAAAGANVLVAGSAIFGGGAGVEENVRSFRNNLRL